MQIVIFNIPVEVIRKNIKNLHLSVLPPDGRVRVSAPTQLTDEAITMFVRTKLGWIKKQQEKFQQQPRQSERQYVSGETLYVWGKQYFLQVEYSYKGNALTLSGDKAILTVRKESIGFDALDALRKNHFFTAGRTKKQSITGIVVKQTVLRAE